MTVFDRRVKRLQRASTIRRADAEDYDYLRNAVAARVVDRVRDVCVGDRKLPACLDLGSNRGHMWPLLREIQEAAGIEKITAVEFSPELLRSAKDEFADTPKAITRICASEEMLPFPNHTFDVVVSSMSLHWVNDLPGALGEVKRVLKPDGVFVGAMLGEQTLQELRSAFILAEQEREGGVAPHISPMAGVGDVGNLLSHVGFSLPTVDQEALNVDFSDPFVLMHELRAMGEQHAPSDQTRKKFTPRSTIAAAAAIYKSLYSHKAPDGTDVIPATFQIIYMIGWSPHSSQPQPKRRGSQTHSFRDLEKMIPNS